MYQIVKFTFPFADNVKKSKPRPALVLSLSFGSHDQLILAYITTNTTEQLDTDILLDSKKEYFSETGLHTTSLVKLHRLITTTPTQIGETIGALPEECIPEVKKRLKKIFQLK
jgi:mRNA-degrading endonuclease toxin of MazEF toxin-antitoxin module